MKQLSILLSAAVAMPSESASALKWFVYNLQTISPETAVIQLAADLELYDLADLLCELF